MCTVLRLLLLLAPLWLSSEPLLAMARCTKAQAGICCLMLLGYQSDARRCTDAHCGALAISMYLDSRLHQLRVWKGPIGPDYCIFELQMKLLGHVGARFRCASHLWTAAAGLTAAGALLFTSEAACEDSKAEAVVAKAGHLAESSLPAAQERPKVCPF